MAEILFVVECVGLFPQQQAFMLLVLLEKPKGGFRSILLAPSLSRLWQRMRRDTLGEFEAAAVRDYWAASRGRSAETTVWAQAIRAEAAKKLGLETAMILRDGRKYSESFLFAKLRQRALRAGIPRVVVKVCYNFWRGPRLLKFLQQFSTRVSYAVCGLPAGDVMGDSFVRAYALEPFDAFIVRHPSVFLDSFIDDNALSAVGPQKNACPKLDSGSKGP